MPKSAGRGVVFAALAVPLALMAAPLTASAEEPDDVVISDQALAGAVATPDAAAAMASATTTTTVEEAEDADVWDGPRPDLVYVPETVDVSYSSDEDVTEDITEDVAEDVTEDATEEATEEATEDATEEYSEETSTEAVAVVAPVHDMSVVDDSDWVGATYEDVVAHAGSDGAWVTSTESGAVSGDDGVLSGSDTAAWYEEVTAAAGSDGAFVESTESEAFSGDGWGHGDLVDGDFDGDYAGDFDDDVTGAAYEHTAAAAGEDGAWVENVESGAFELD